MIRVTIELLPHGDASCKRTLGTLDISNDATGDQQTGNYHGVLHAEYTPANGRKGRVTAFNRKSQSAWSLVGAFLKLFGHTSHSPKLMSKLPDSHEGNTEPTQILLPDTNEPTPLT